MDIATMKQGLQETFGILNGISVPIGMLQQIGLPILNALENIGKIINAIEEKEAEAQKKQDSKMEEKAIREEDI